MELSSYSRIFAICSGLIGFSGKSPSPSVSESSSMPYLLSRESFCARSAATAAEVAFCSRIGKQQQKNLMRDPLELPRNSPVWRTCRKDGLTRPPVRDGIYCALNYTEQATIGKMKHTVSVMFAYVGPATRGFGDRSGMSIFVAQLSACVGAVSF